MRGGRCIRSREGARPKAGLIPFSITHPDSNKNKEREGIVVKGGTQPRQGRQRNTREGEAEKSNEQFYVGDLKGGKTVRETCTQKKVKISGGIGELEREGA